MKSRKLSRALAYLLTLVLLILVVFPVYITLSTSLKPAHEVNRYPPALIPAQPTLENYAVLLSDRNFVRYTYNTGWVALATTAGSVLLGTLSAYALSRYRFKGNRFLSQTVLLIYMFPPVLLVIPLYLLMSRWGLIDNLLALVICYTTFSLPLCIWMLKGFFDGLPVEIEDAGRIDGCTELGVLFRIVLPLSAPGIVATMAFSFMLVWGEYMFAVTLIRSDANKTLVAGLAAIIGQYWMSYGRVMAASVLASIPAIAFFFAAQRYIVRGLVSGAMKG